MCIYFRKICFRTRDNLRPVAANSINSLLISTGAAPCFISYFMKFYKDCIPYVRRWCCGYKVYIKERMTAVLYVRCTVKKFMQIHQMHLEVILLDTSDVPLDTTLLAIAPPLTYPQDLHFFVQIPMIRCSKITPSVGEVVAPQQYATYNGNLLFMYIITLAIPCSKIRTPA